MGYNAKKDKAYAYAPNRETAPSGGRSRMPIWGPRRNRRKIYGNPIDACFTIEKSLIKTELMCLTTTGTVAIDVRLSCAS